MELELVRQSVAGTAFTALVFNIFVCRETLLARTFRTPIGMTSRAIDTLERRYNRPELSAGMRRADGMSAIVALIVGGLGIGWALDWILEQIPYAWLLEGLIVGMLLIMRSHLDQTRVLFGALERSTTEAQATLALISGNDTYGMDDAALAECGVRVSARVLIEGFLAPMIYYMLAGLPGLIVFKVVNTAYVMIDEKTDYAADFGWGSEKLNGWMVWPTARLAAVLFVLASVFLRGLSALGALSAALKEHAKCTPSRLGWAISAMGGAIGMAALGQDEMCGPGSANDFMESSRNFAEARHLELMRRLYLGTAGVIAFALAVIITFDGWLPGDFF